MKKYIWNEYRDKRGTGSVKIFDTLEDALKAASDHWLHLCEADKLTYLKDPASMYCVYIADVETDEDGEQYPGEPLEDVRDWLADYVEIVNV